MGNDAGDRGNGREFCQSRPVCARERNRLQPQRDRQTGAFGFRPKDVKPLWAEVPVLYAMSGWMQGLVPYAKAAAGNQRRDAAGGQSPWADPSGAVIRPYR